MGVSRERIRQIESRAMRQLRQFAEDARIDLLDGIESASNA
jgi:DNA-directed RNA polymerase sigma subunit (sigma70/sigma32)